MAEPTLLEEPVLSDGRTGLKQDLQCFLLNAVPLCSADKENSVDHGPMLGHLRSLTESEDASLNLSSEP